MSPQPPEIKRARLYLLVTPNAARSGVVGLDEAEVKIRIAAPPAEGKANKALIRFLSAHLGVPPSHVSLVRGAGSRRKVVEVTGLSTEEALVRLQPV